MLTIPATIGPYLFSQWSVSYWKDIYSLVFEHLTERDLVCGAQCGFTPGKSTVTALLSTLHILQLLEAGLDVSLVFFYLCKAFDSILHLPLLQKLRDISLNQHILQWIASYLSNRQQYVVVGGASSESTPVLSEVSQGSVLGPLLFLIYINHVSSLNITDGSKITMYADDILLFKSIDHPDAYSDLQRDINTIHECTSTCHLTLNPSEYKCIVVSKRRQPHRPPVRLRLHNILEQVERYRS